ncbi:MAG: hypothetical protein ACW99G_24260 [Candidatus Thorarchaeota archaeon]|jgi:hypothetical protein
MSKEKLTLEEVELTIITILKGVISSIQNVIHVIEEYKETEA